MCCAINLPAANWRLQVMQTKVYLGCCLGTKYSGVVLFIVAKYARVEGLP